MSFSNLWGRRDSGTVRPMETARDNVMNLTRPTATHENGLTKCRPFVYLVRTSIVIRTKGIEQPSTQYDFLRRENSQPRDMPSKATKMTLAVPTQGVIDTLTQFVPITNSIVAEGDLEVKQVALSLQAAAATGQNSTNGAEMTGPSVELWSEYNNAVARKSDVTTPTHVHQGLTNEWIVFFTFVRISS